MTKMEEQKMLDLSKEKVALEIQVENLRKNVDYWMQAYLDEQKRRADVQLHEDLLDKQNQKLKESNSTLEKRNKIKAVIFQIKNFQLATLKK